MTPSLLARSIEKLGRLVVLPLLPKRLRLPFRWKIHSLEPECELELKYLEHMPCKRVLAIDVGANRGLYSYRMSKLFSRVVSFEANPTITGDLKSFNPGNIEIMPFALSSSTGTLCLHIPMVRGVLLNGWASLDEKAMGGFPEQKQFQVDARTLDSFEFTDVSLIKIDVEGHEIEVLKGALETLQRCQPVLIVEVQQHNKEAIASLLTGLGYELLPFHQMVGAKLLGPNCVYVPVGMHTVLSNNKL